jgi:hypothetical protein
MTPAMTFRKAELLSNFGGTTTSPYALAFLPPPSGRRATGCCIYYCDHPLSYFRHVHSSQREFFHLKFDYIFYDIRTPFLLAL